MRAWGDRVRKHRETARDEDHTRLLLRQNLSSMVPLWTVDAHPFRAIWVTSGSSLKCKEFGRAGSVTGEKEVEGPRRLPHLALRWTGGQY